MEYTKEETEDGVDYKFVIDGVPFLFEIVKFEGIDEYNSYLEDGDEKLFKDLDEYKNQIKTMVGYYWDFDHNSSIVNTGKKVNTMKLMRTLEFLGKEYVMLNFPDVIFYEAKNPKFHRVYSRMFPAFGYNCISNLKDEYIFVRTQALPLTYKDNTYGVESL